MKQMKVLSVGKMLGSIRKKASGSNDNVASRALEGGGAPEVVARNNVTAFCEAGGSVQGDEVLFLPPIVDVTESSPTAAAEAARYIRRFMGKDYLQKPSRQYNAVMLLRILSDYPGPQFTKNIDDKFIETTAYLLKKARDPSLRQLLMETLDDMEHSKMDDQNLFGLVSMWKKEKEKALKDYGGVPNIRTQPIPSFRPNAPARSNPHSQNYFARSHRSTQLPDPVELASRLEEARTSAKLLEQVVMNTPPAEMLDNELIREFADRCLSASRSIQGYMVCDNPAPDNETMENLIDTNEQLQTALNQHQRAVLSARKQVSNESETPLAAPTNNYRQAPPAMAGASGSASAGPPSRASTPSPPPPMDRKGKGKGKQAEDPFADPEPNGGSYNNEERLAFEPFHPGFNNNHAGASGSAGGARPVNDYEVSDDDLYEPNGRGKEPARGV